MIVESVPSGLSSFSRSVSTRIKYLAQCTYSRRSHAECGALRWAALWRVVVVRLGERELEELVGEDRNGGDGQRDNNHHSQAVLE